MFTPSRWGHPLLILSPGSAGLFTDLRQLDYLSLRKNRLSTLRPGVFDTQIHLTVLELSANKIASVSEPRRRRGLGMHAQLLFVCSTLNTPSPYFPPHARSHKHNAVVADLARFQLSCFDSSLSN